MGRRHVRERVLEAGAQLTSQARVARGLPAPAARHPHTMRRAYVSIMLLATEFDLPFVQHQAGQADSELTLDACATSS